MKKFIALTCALTLTFSMTVCAAGSPTTQKSSGSSSSSASLESAVVATEVVVAPVTPSGLSPLETAAQTVGKTLTEYVSNSIAQTPGIPDAAPISQGGGCVINGAASNATFTLNRVEAEVSDYALAKAKAVGGSVLNVVNLTAPGVNFSDAEVGFHVEGVKAGDQIKVYKAVKGDWQEVEVTEVSDNSVKIKMDSVGIFNFVKIG